MKNTGWAYEIVVYELHCLYAITAVVVCWLNFLWVWQIIVLLLNRCG